MSYVKTTWQNGDTVNAEKLNHIEDGIAAVDTAQAAVFAPDITNPQDGDTLVYDATAGKWVNGATSGGGLVVPVYTTADFSTFTCDHTLGEIETLINANRVCMAKVIDTQHQDAPFFLPLGDIVKEGGELSQITFIGCNVTIEGAIESKLVHTSSTILFTETTYPSGD